MLRSFTSVLVFSLSLALPRAHGTILSGATDLGAIWFVGDSITQSNADGDSNGSPRKSLYDRLTTGGYTFSFTGSSTANPDGLSGVNYTSHSGYSGSIISYGGNLGRVDMTASLSSQWITGRLASVKPNIALIMLGTNDIDVMSTTGYTPATISLNLQAYVNSIYGLPGSINPTVFVSTIAPNRTSAQDPANVIAFNNALRDTVAALHAAQKDVYLVDAYTPLNNNYSTAMKTDNLHPNTVGNGLIADAWFAGIQSRVTAVPEPSTGILIGLGSSVGVLLRRRRGVSKFR